MKLELPDGRAITMQSLEQSFTYAGRLCGRSMPSDNNRRMAEFVVEVSRRFPWAREPLVLPPVRKVVPARPDRHVPEGEELPSVLSLAQFRSNSPANDSGECYSSALFVWFQDEFGLPDERAREALRQVQWRSVAWDWTP